MQIKRNNLYLLNENACEAQTKTESDLKMLHIYIS